jgi:hypothetical protein
MPTSHQHPTGPTRLNDLQLHMLRVFERKLTKKQEAELKKLVADYFAQLVDEQVDELLATGQVNLDELERVGEESDRSKLKRRPRAA